MFLSQQVKRKVYITNKNGKYELTHEFPNNVRLLKSQNSMELQSSFLPKMKISVFLEISQNSQENTRAIVYF